MTHLKSTKGNQRCENTEKKSQIWTCLQSKPCGKSKTQTVRPFCNIPSPTLTHEILVKTCEKPDIQTYRSVSLL